MKTIKYTIYTNGFVAATSNDGRHQHYTTHEELERDAPEAAYDTTGRGLQYYACTPQTPAVRVETSHGDDYGWGFGDSPVDALADALGEDWEGTTL